MKQDELSMRERGRLWVRLGIRGVLTFAVLAFLHWGGKPLFSLCLPFVLAFVLAWALNPVIRGIQKRLGVSRGVLSLILILILLGLVGGVLFILSYNIVSELVSLANNWQVVWNGVLNAMSSVGGFFSRFYDLLPPEVVTSAEGVISNGIAWLQGALSGAATNFAARAGSVAMSVPPFAVAVIVFIMGAYFISADYPRLRFLVTEHMSGSMRRFFHQLRVTALAAFGGYLRAELIVSVGVFGILAIGYLIIGQSYALLLAFLLAVLDFIPIIGSGTVMVPWAVISLCMGNARHAVQLMVIWGVIVLFRRVAEPKIVGDQTGLSPILSLLSIYIGMRVAGVAGMVLGPIVCMIVINLFKTGIFDGLVADVRLAARDTTALLKNRPE